MHEPDCGGGLLVGMDLGVGNPGVVINGGMEVGVANAAALGTGYLASSPCSPAAPGGDPTQFLDIDVEELSGSVLFVAADVTSGGGIKIPQPGDPETDQHPPHRGRIQPEVTPNHRWSPSSVDPQSNDSPLSPGWEPARTLMRSDRRSTNPASPSATHRFHHRYAVVRDTPISAATCATGRPASIRSHRIRRPVGVRGALACAMSLLLGCGLRASSTQPEEAHLTVSTTSVINTPRRIG